MKKEPKLQKQKFGDMCDVIAEHFGLNNQEVKRVVAEHFPEVKNKAKCANCDANMAIYEFKIDSLDALLIYGMGQQVRRNLDDGLDFTEANQVHVQSKLNQYYSVASRTTQCRQLGLIAKVKNEDGSHNRKAGWLITKRGFEFLKNKPTPYLVTSFRNKIVDRSEKTITIKEALADRTTNYDEHDWVNIDSYRQGKLL